MSFIQDDYAVPVEVPFVERLSKEHTVSHIWRTSTSSFSDKRCILTLDLGFWRRAVLETDSIAYGGSEFTLKPYQRNSDAEAWTPSTNLHLFADALCDRHRGDTTRLSTTYNPMFTVTILVEKLCQLGRLP